MQTSKRVFAYLLIATLGCGGLACGDDDDAAAGSSASGKGGSGSSGKGGSGSSGKGGSGGSGTAGSSGKGSAGSTGSDMPTADDALSGACGMMDMTTGMDPMCTGIEEYVACVQSECGANDCMKMAACKTYVDCVQNADDPCNNDCAPTGECVSCYSSTASCASSMCFDKIQCGDRMDGGACDQLDDCCASLDADMKMVCDMVAGPTKAGGDMACQQLIDAFCP